MKNERQENAGRALLPALPALMAFLSGLEAIFFNRAVIFAAKAHDGQVRKGTDIPYIVHPMEAAAITAGMTDNPEVIANRRRSNKKGWVVFIVTIAVCQVIGVALGLYLHFTRTPEPATFSSDGITLTLTDDFSAMDYDPFTATFASREVAVYALKEPFTLAEGMDSMTLDEYADIVIQNNNLSPDCKQTTNGQIHMTYDFFNEEMNTTYRYRAYVYKSDDAFWLVQFVTKAADAQAYADRVASWAGSVTFD